MQVKQIHIFTDIESQQAIAHLDSDSQSFNV